MQLSLNLEVIVISLPEFFLHGLASNKKVSHEYKNLCGDNNQLLEWIASIRPRQSQFRINAKIHEVVGTYTRFKGSILVTDAHNLTGSFNSLTDINRPSIDLPLLSSFLIYGFIYGLDVYYD